MRDAACAHVHHHRLHDAKQRGASMVVALIVAGVLSATSLASTESFLLAIRASEQAMASVWRFHAAEAALIACERRLIDALSVNLSLNPDPFASADPDRFDVLAAEMGLLPEPIRWRRTDAFAGSSAETAMSEGTLTHWRLMHGGQPVDVPCLQEIWIDRPGLGQVYLMTVRVSPEAYERTRLPGTSPQDRGLTLRRSGREAAGVWLQSITVWTGGRHRHFWRPVAEPPS